MNETEMKNSGRRIGAVDFFFIGFGSIVGVGWAVSINGWMASCGGPVPAALGYLLVLAMLIPIALCYCELVPMYPVAGGGMIFAFKGFNRHIAMLSGWTAFGAFVAIVPWEAIQVTDVLGYLIPALKSGDPVYRLAGSDIYLSSLIMGVSFSILIFLLNIRGFAAAAKAQKILCSVLVSAALVGAVFSLIGGQLSNLLPVNDVSNPGIYGSGLRQVNHQTLFGGAFSIVASAAFFLAGFETIPQGIESAGGEPRSVGKTVVFSVLAACLFYACLLFCYGCGMPWQEFALVNRPAAASLFLFVFPGKLGKVLFWLLALGAVAGLFTPWNGFFTPSANLLMCMGRGRMLPGIFARQNKKGIAVYGLIVVLLLSCVGPFLGPNLIDSITCFSSAAFMLSWSITAWSLVACRLRYPDQKRPYRIPGGIVMGIYAGLVSLAAFVFMFVPSSPFYIGAVAVKMFLGWTVLGAVLYLSCAGQRKNLSAEAFEKGLFGSNDAAR